MVTPLQGSGDSRQETELAKQIRVFGHRGVPGLEPENTMASFHRAVELGADGLELDLRLSRDGHFMVMHDASLGRTSSGRGWVHLRSRAYLRRLDAGAWFRGHPTSERVPTLEEVLSELPPHLLLNLEIKAGVFSMRRWGHRLAKVLARWDAKERVLISSFSAPVLRLVRHFDGDLPLASLAENLERALAVGSDALHPRASATNRTLVDRAHACGLAVHPWDADEEDELRRLIDLGVDGIITDEVARLVRLLGRR